MKTPLNFSDFVEMRLQSDKVKRQPNPQPPSIKAPKGPVGLPEDTPANRWKKTLQIAWDAGTELSKRRGCNKS